jgi:LAO/AO transport system kinase
MDDLVRETLRGNRRALSRLLTYVENQREGAAQALAELFPQTGRAWVIGVTGSPGTGKSSLVNALAKAFRAQSKTVGIIAVDPTSPFSGGAIMGDRIRMRDLAGDKGVFIRSMATRGSLGGLARATRDVIRALDAAGFDVIFVETVGAGQSEVDIVRTAQTTVVVEAPGMGDDVQAIKAGILEIADVLVVNKADRPGADNTVRALRTMLEMGHPAARAQLTSHHGQLMPPAASVNGSEETLWIPPVVRTIALEDQGIGDLMAALESHRQHLVEAQVLTNLERQHIEIELYDRLQAALMARLLKTIPSNTFTDFIHRIQTRELDPQTAVEAILALPNQPM